MATHLPLGQVSGYYALAYPKAEPVIASKISRVPEGMYLNVENPSRSSRTKRQEKGDIYGIIAGTSFTPVHVDEERKFFEDIALVLPEYFETRQEGHLVGTKLVTM